MFDTAQELKEGHTK